MSRADEIFIANCRDILENGGGTITPTGNTKRCEFAAAITRFAENVAAR